jgi:hypothetical protein
MNQRTIATLNELEGINWFTKVGLRDSDYPVFLKTWKDAIESCESDAWESLRLEAANQYCERLQEHNVQRFDNWNILVQEVQQIVTPLVLRKTKTVVEANRLPKIFVDSVNWDILHLCMEAEYGDIFPPGFYASQAYWYVHGHFPCGWQGNFPDGRLIVF